MKELGPLCIASIIFLPVIGVLGLRVRNHYLLKDYPSIVPDQPTPQPPASTIEIIGLSSSDPPLITTAKIDQWVKDMLAQGRHV